MKQERLIAPGFRRAPPFEAGQGPPERSLDFVISNGLRDRYRTVLNPHGWLLDGYSRNPVVGYGHSLLRAPSGGAQNPDEVIGRGSVWLDGAALIGRVTFDPPDVNPLAEKIYRKVLLGSLNAASVSFLAVGPQHYGTGDEALGGPRETRYLDGQELLEFSIVNVPANPWAVRRAAPAPPEGDPNLSPPSDPDRDSFRLLRAWRERQTQQ